MQRSGWETNPAAEREVEKTANERAQQELKNRLEKEKADEGSYAKQRLSKG